MAVFCTTWFPADMSHSPPDPKKKEFRINPATGTLFYISKGQQLFNILCYRVDLIRSHDKGYVITNSIFEYTLDLILE
jgi:hypothetical protein